MKARAICLARLGRPACRRVHGRSFQRGARSMRRRRRLPSRWRFAARGEGGALRTESDLSPLADQRMAALMQELRSFARKPHCATRKDSSGSMQGFSSPVEFLVARYGQPLLLIRLAQESNCASIWSRKVIYIPRSSRKVRLGSPLNDSQLKLVTIMKRRSEINTFAWVFPRRLK